MTLEDLAKAAATEKGFVDTQAEQNFIGDLQSSLKGFHKAMKRNLILETLVAVIAFVSVVTLLVFGGQLYPRVVELLVASYQGAEAKMNIPMYISLGLMAFYCVMVPVKRYLALTMEESIDWTVTARVESEIERLEQQRTLWSTSHIWSIAPAAVIGVLFFWGLNKSLLGSWFPSVYLWCYLGFVTVWTLATLRLKRDLIGNKIQPLLDRLYGVREQIHGDND